VQDAAGTLIGVDPVPDLHERELKDAQVDYVSGELPDLDAVVHFERPARNKESPADDIADRVLQGDDQGGREQAEIGGQGSRSGQPNAADQENSKRHRSIGDTFSPAVQGAAIFGAAADHEWDAENADERGKKE
jgi:hypothetical protein